MQELLSRRSNLMRFAYRHFPLINVHPYAEPAAEAAEAAGARGRFWPVHDWLFANQDRLSPVTLIAALVDMGLDGEAIAGELRDHAFLDKIQPRLHRARRSRGAAARRHPPAYELPRPAPALAVTA